MDIGFNNQNGVFKFRVCGIIKQDNHILTVKSPNFPAYILPGGHVELGETTKTAVLREIKEELNIDTTIENLVCVNENIFTLPNGKTFHEIGYYYTLKPTTQLPLQDFTLDEIDKGIPKTHFFKWVNIETIHNFNLIPPFIGKMIQDNAINQIHTTYENK